MPTAPPIAPGHELATETSALPAPITAKEWVQRHAHQLWERRGGPLRDDWADWFAALDAFDELSAERQIENFAWLKERRDRLTAENPSWEGKFLAIASRTGEKVLAVADDWKVAYTKGLKSLELRLLAVEERVPANVLLSIAVPCDP